MDIQTGGLDGWVYGKILERWTYRVYIEDKRLRC